MSHRPALVTVSAASALDLAGGVLFAHVEHLSTGLGIYWAVTTATTVGYGDITPHTVLGHWIAVLVMLTVVPLVAATFSLFTAGLSYLHFRSIRRRLEHIIDHHPDIPPLESGPSPSPDD